MMRKILIYVLMVLILISVITGCSKSEKETAQSDAVSKSEKDSITLGFSVFTMVDPNLQLAKQFQEDLAKTRGEELGIEINTVFTDAQGNVDKQISDVETLITRNVDAISIKSVDVDGSVPAFVACKEAGIPVLDAWFGTHTDAATFKYFFLDNYKIGQMQAEWAIKYAEDNDVNLIMGLQSGVSGQEDTMKRSNAIQDTIKEKYGSLTGGQVEVVAIKACENDASLALSVTEDWLQRYPDMNGVFAYCDNLAMSAVNIFKAAGKNMEDAVIVSVDGTVRIAEVKNGNIDATIQLSMPKILTKEFDLLLDLAMGKPAKMDPDFSVLNLVDSSNIDQYYNP